MTKRLLLYLLAFAVIPSALVACGMILILNQQLAEKADRQLTLTAHEAVEDLDRFILDRLNLARILPRIPVLREAAEGVLPIDDRQVMAAMRETLLDDPVFTESCAIVDQLGNVVASTAIAEVNTVERKQDYFAGSLAANGPMLYVQLDPQTDRPDALVIAGPWRNEQNELVGLIRWRMFPAAIDRFIFASSELQDQYMDRVLVRSDGTMLSAQDKWYDRKPKGFWRQLLLKQPTWTSFEDDTYRLVRVGLAMKDWSALALVPQERWNPIGLSLWMYAGFGLMMTTAIIFLLGVVSARILTRPLVSLTKDISSINRTNLKLPAIAGSNVREVQVLHQGFVDLLERLQVSFDERDTVARRLNVAQAELVEREEYYRELFDGSPDAIAVVEGRTVVDANKAFRSLFGDELVLPLPRGSDGKLTLEVDRLMRRAEIGSDVQSTMDLYRENGRVFTAQVRIGALVATETVTLLLVIRDVSQQRHMEIQLRQSFKMDAVGQLAGGVAHDFNNMLGVILPAVDMLLAKKDGDERQQRLLQSIRLASERAEGLTSKLLAFSRKGKIVSTPVRVHDVVKDVEVLLERSVDKRIVLETDLQATCDWVVGDPNQLESALLNLGINARDAMHEGGRLKFHTENMQVDRSKTIAGHFILEPGQYIRLTVQDNGTGIEARNIERIFEPFFTTKDQGAGTGLGLAAVYGAIEEHRGAIEVTSELGAGSSFSLYLPVEEKLVESNDHLQTADLSARFGSGVILVVEDEEMLRVTAGMLLEDLGFSVDYACDGKQGVKLFSQNPERYVAILLDQIMPVMNGLDAAQKMYDINPHVPVLLCSGFPREAAITEGMGTILQGFLQKPFSRMVLAQSLKEVIQK